MSEVNELEKLKTNSRVSIVAICGLIISILSPIMLIGIIRSYNSVFIGRNPGYIVIFLILFPIFLNIYALIQKHKKYKFISIIGLVINILTIAGSMYVVYLIASAYSY